MRRKRLTLSEIDIRKLGVFVELRVSGLIAGPLDSPTCLARKTLSPITHTKKFFAREEKSYAENCYARPRQNERLRALMREPCVAGKFVPDKVTERSDALGLRQGIFKRKRFHENRRSAHALRTSGGRLGRYRSAADADRLVSTRRQTAFQAGGEGRRGAKD